MMSLFKTRKSVHPVLPEDWYLRLRIPLPGELSQVDESILKTDRLLFQRRPHENSADFGIGIYISKRLLEKLNGHLNLGLMSDAKTPAVFFDFPLIEGTVSEARYQAGCPDEEEGAVKDKVDLLSPSTEAAVNPSKLKSEANILPVDHSATTIKSPLDVVSIISTNPLSNVEAVGASTFDSVDEGLNILVVDDSSLTRKILIKVMLSMGHRCSEAEDGSVAVEMVQRSLQTGTLFDVILMDNV